MPKAPTPQSKPTVDDDELPKTAVKERDSVRLLREQQTLAAYADPDDTPQIDTWEKRYGDLRRHQQKKEQDAQKRINDLEAQINNLQSTVNRPMPKTKEELEAWKQQYPDVAAIMETLVDERASLKTKQLEEQIGGLTGELSQTKQERSKAQLASLVPDYKEVLKTSEWKAWFSEFPEAVQEQMMNSDDPLAVAKFINKFKDQMDAKVPATKTIPDRATVLEASVRNSGIGPASRQQNYKFSQLQIKAMSPKEFEKNEAAIDEARAAGLILDDMRRPTYITDYR